jgi:nucleotide sugar dehydrogenase
MTLATEPTILRDAPDRSPDAHRLLDASPATATERGRPTVAVVGLGYVGLPTALSLVASGACVVGVDADPARLRAIRTGRVDLLDRDHQRLADVAEDQLRLTTDLSDVAGESDAIVVCVPTPVDEHRAPDLRPLRTACDEVVACARPGQVLILTSTTYVGSTRDLLVRPLAARGLEAGRDVWVAFSPERIDPANDEFPPERVPRVVGGWTTECAARAAAIIARVAPSVHVVSSAAAAEMTKLYENTFRAVNIALANELASVSRGLELDAIEVVEAAATKPYGFLPFFPGPGVGGHCIPCDPHYLLWQLRAQHRRAPIVEEAMSAIDARPNEVVDRASQVLSDHGKPLQGARILLVGVTYKPGVADVRESPALQILDQLIGRGAEVSFTDAHVREVRLPSGTLLGGSDPSEVTAPDLVLVHTVHPEVDHGWIEGHPAVLDATYRLDVAHRHVP